MKYTLYFKNPHRHRVTVGLQLPASSMAQTLLLSRWRPGRYELAPYAENIHDFSAVTASGMAITLTRTSSHSWSIPPVAEPVTVTYDYYAADRSAGASHFDSEQIYLNPINLLLYPEGGIAESCELQLHLPAGFELACGMRREGNTLFARDFHELADCPLFAAAEMQCISLTESGIPFYLWFLGRVKPQAEKIIADFSAFIRAQLALFGSAPFTEYHFLFQMREDAFYHGVEHQNSTVIALGPALKLMQKELYDEFLGISSHELFHAWNVKAIRPADMQPYRYEEANYSQLHYVTEGVTTYYGDLMLLKSGVWSLHEFLDNFNTSTVLRTFNSDSWQHISLEQSSFESWVNGYKDTVPNRRLSFYTKGALVAFLLDYQIRKGSGNQRSLDTVMQQLWLRFGRTGLGYTRADYQSIAEDAAGISLDAFFADYISGTQPLFGALREAAAYFGLQFQSRPHSAPSVQRWGFTLEGNAEVKQVFENSPADVAAFEKGDRLIAINEVEVIPGTFQDLLAHFAGEESLRFTVFRKGRLLTLEARVNRSWQGQLHEFTVLAEASPEQAANRSAWMSLQPAAVQA